MGTYYKHVEKFIDRIDLGAWIEIGIDRGEGSTKFFADLAKTKQLNSTVSMQMLIKSIVLNQHYEKQRS
jgi:hypothetical protein